MARRSKLTPAIAKRIVELIEGGCFTNQAAAAVGITEPTYYNWLRRGKAGLELLEDEEQEDPGKDEEPYIKFAQAIIQAEAKAEAEAVGRIVKAAKTGTWQADAWYLERKHADRWGRKDKHQVEANVESNQTINSKVEVSDLSNADLEAVIYD